MLYGLYTSGLGAVGQSVRLDVIAHNLANVNTPGYRRDRIAFQERWAEALEDRPDLKYYNGLVHRQGGAPFIGQIAFDREAGRIATTDRTLDFAIHGSGYFTVQDRNNGRFYYTRAGNFILDGQGNVVTPDGKYQLTAEDGAGVKVDPTVPQSEIRMDKEGTLRQADEFLHRLAIVDFADPAGVRKFGGNLFENFGTEAVEAKGYEVLQGALEGSSANPVSEMVEMIRAIRSIETNLQMIRIQDSTLDRVVNDFGRPAR